MAEQTPQQRLVEWFQYNGGHINSALELVASTESGQHFRATQDISILADEHALLCKCLFSLTLSHLNILPSPPSTVEDLSKTNICSLLVGKINAAAMAYFLLVEERLKGSESHWEPYISALPKVNELCTPPWFSEEDLKWLLGTTIHADGHPSRSVLEMRRTTWKEHWLQGIEILKSHEVAVEKFTWELFLWAATIFTSRGFTSSIAMGLEAESFGLLYPVLDSFNHRFGAKVLWNIDQGNFDLSTTESMTKGAEVYNNYAPKGNEELLMGYGFCVPSNPCDEVGIKISRPPDHIYQVLRTQFPDHFSSPEMTSEAFTFFLRSSSHYSGGYQVGIPCLRGLPQEMFGTLRVMMAFALKVENEKLSEDDLDNATIDAILDRLLDKREAIRTWDDVIPQQPRNARQTFAKMYRDGQLQILEEIIQELQSHLDQEWGLGSGDS